MSFSFPVIESHLRRDCCLRKKFNLRYSKEWKKIIPKERYQEDLRDINNVYRKHLPWTVIYFLIGFIIFGCGIALMCWSLIKDKKHIKDTKKEAKLQAAFVLMAAGIVIGMMLSFIGWCQKRTAVKKLKSFVKDINTERWYRQRNLKWELIVVFNKPKYIRVVSGNDYKGDSSGAERTRNSDVERIKDKYSKKDYDGSRGTNGSISLTISDE